MRIVSSPKQASRRTGQDIHPSIHNRRARARGHARRPHLIPHIRRGVELVLPHGVALPTLAGARREGALEAALHKRLAHAAVAGSLVGVGAVSREMR